jgi:hypothetical protein
MVSIGTINMVIEKKGGKNRWGIEHGLTAP